jgi:TusA-related sulfurtransferase
LEKAACHRIDLSGLFEPFTLLKISQIFRALEVGEQLEIYWDDSGSCGDLFKILPQSSYEILSTVDSGNICKVKLIKTALSSESSIPAGVGGCTVSGRSDQKTRPDGKAGKTNPSRR